MDGFMYGPMKQAQIAEAYACNGKPAKAAAHALVAVVQLLSVIAEELHNAQPTKVQEAVKRRLPGLGREETTP